MIVSMRGVRCLAGEGREADARGGAGDGNGAAGIGRGGKRGLQRCAEGGRKRRRGERRAEKKDSGCAGILLRYSGRSDWIRTSDPLVPNQVRYQAAPRSVTAHAAPEGGVSFQKANLFRDNAEVVAAVLRPHGGTGAFTAGRSLPKEIISIWSGFTPSMTRYS